MNFRQWQGKQHCMKEVSIEALNKKYEHNPRQWFLLFILYSFYMRTLKEGKVLLTKISLIPVHFGFFKISILSEKKTPSNFSIYRLFRYPTSARAGCAPCRLCSVQSVHLEVCAVNRMFTSFDQSRKYYEYNRISLYTMEKIPNVDSICTNSVRLLTRFWTYSVHFSLYLQCGKWVILKASTVEVKAVFFSVKNNTLP